MPLWIATWCPWRVGVDVDLDLTGTWVITGGTSGLGLAAARSIVAEGGDVLLVSRDAQRGREAADTLGPRASWVAGDLADPDLVDRIAADHPLAGLRGAVLSVGGPPAGTTTQVSDEDWRNAFESVFLGPVRLSRSLAQACPQLEVLAWVLSTSARSPIPGLSISNGLRPGLAMLVKDLADELGPRGIRVVGLLPGRFDTPRVRYLESMTGDAATARTAATSQIPLRRLGEPTEFGQVAAFLLSPRASYVTGSLVAVDGGAARAL